MPCTQNLGETSRNLNKAGLHSNLSQTVPWSKKHKNKNQKPKKPTNTQKNPKAPKNQPSWIHNKGIK